jgi:hypothetical protein
MKRNLVLASALALAITGGSYGIANAQDARKPVTIDVAKACGVVTLTFTNPNTDVSKIQGFTWNAVNGNVATAVGKRTGDVTVGPTKTVKETITFPEDEFGGVGAVTVVPTFGPDNDIQPRLDIYPVDTDCKPPAPPTKTPDPTTPVPPPTTQKPPVTTQNPPPVTTPPVVDDKDCKDFATQADAQKALTAGDPLHLDSDNDGQACEEFFTGNPPAIVNNNTNVNNPPPAVNSPQIQRVPVGGVETGDGSLA